MTLNLMLINTSGVWQSSDCRLVDPQSLRLVDDYSVKHVVLRCRDGVAVLAYCGLGAVRGVHIADWIRQILRGESRTVDESLILLREQATADLGPIAKGRVHHIFTIGAFLQGQPWAVQIRNFTLLDNRGFGTPGQEFMTVARRVDEHGQHFALGAPSVVASADQATLARVARVRPRKPSDFRKLLAAINHRASQTPIGMRTVSPHCVTTYVPPAGEPAEQEIHGAEGQRKAIVIPLLLFGIDTTDMMRSLLDRGGIADAGQESVTPRNPLKQR